jgi:hypothetical protein
MFEKLSFQHPRFEARESQEGDSAKEIWTRKILGRDQVRSLQFHHRLP